MAIRLTNAELVTIAVGNLDGHKRAIDTEDIALHAYEIAPGKFGWRKHPGHIDLEVVRRALRDSRSAKHGALINGASKAGWRLSRTGLAWYLGLDEKDSLPDGSLIAERHGSLLHDQERERQRMCATRAVRLFLDDDQDQITRRDFFDFVKINEYFTPNARRRRYDFVESAISQNQDLSNLWQFMQDRFAKEFE